MSFHATPLLFIFRPDFLQKPPNSFAIHENLVLPMTVTMHSGLMSLWLNFSRCEQEKTSFQRCLFRQKKSKTVPHHPGKRQQRIFAAKTSVCAKRAKPPNPFAQLRYGCRSATAAQTRLL